uniref:BHLH domain-containing protein n=1 Tax=Arion vulgaris TaxID=1028688 RepID=A0A0B6XYB1_9EUPU
MKAVVATERPRSCSILGVKKDANCSIMKTATIDFHGEKFSISEEMKECFLKLSDMVPDVPRNEDGNIDGTVLMQYVIDYILDLELQLDTQGPFSSGSFSSSFQAKFVSETSTREPLSEKSLENIVLSQVPSSPLSYSDESLSLVSECDIRPPSK